MQNIINNSAKSFHVRLAVAVFLSVLLVFVGWAAYLELWAQPAVAQRTNQKTQYVLSRGYTGCLMLS